MSVVYVTEENFKEEVLESNIPVLVDFWAEWCGPCKMIGPIIDQLSQELKGRVKVAKVNVDEAQSLAGDFNIMSMPTLLIFKGGTPVEQMVGAMSKDQLLEKINRKIQ